MNTTWQNITQVMAADLWIRVEKFLAQSPTLPPQETGFNTYVQNSFQQIGAFLPRLLGAVLILLAGWLIAASVAAVTRGILNRTQIDNRIAAGVVGREDNQLPKIEKLISNLVFWGILLLTLVAVLDTLELRVASQPLNTFLNQIGDFLPRLVGALIFAGVAWLVASVVKLITIRGLQALRIDERLSPPEDGGTTQNQLPLSNTIGNALYWFIFLLFLMPILDTLGLQRALQPVETLVTEILAILPNVLGAIIIGVVGWFIATIVQRIVTNLLAATGIDNLGTRLGLSRTEGTQPLSRIIGTIVYVLILIPVAIAALNTLQIAAISVPAIAMLQQVLNVLPAIFTAIAILILAYFLGRFVADLVTNILTSIGFNNILSVLGISPPPRRIVIPAEEPTAPTPPSRTPSEIAGIIVLVGIMLFATVAAVNILNIPALTMLVTGIVVVLGRILAGVIIFAIGLYLANLAFNIITSSGNPQARILGQVTRIAIITLVTAMALQQIGVAPDIVNLAFGLLLGAIAVAIALAFGLGSRDLAREQVQEWLESFKNRG
ncbi:mechanosensitive ion channel [Fischerella thermalis]|uniref:mechanosensitive ion channel n=1 Tax=Fischerella thermalis TaxID=372787 RepID=UPI001A08F5A3|nr:mechanosensitive ion channel [Fischerella thermalis]MBF1990329.1 mechanosensitive ion channel [Fischerella thermalis M58_A2018_009]MBF2059965.1 mechanosensitive ion channel [Fischerella thermalis M66_A2018_004]MBF2069871.1 mechanosensitive ion channel [Fischerella thermalis M48_A2018_028]